MSLTPVFTIFTAGFFLSLLLWFARYRFPTIPRWVATEGMVICACVVAWHLMPSIKAGPALLAIAGMAALAGAFEWHQSYAAASAAKGKELELDKPTPSPTASPPPSTAAVNHVSAPPTINQQSFGSGPVIGHNAGTINVQAPAAGNSRGEVVRALKTFSVDLGTLSDAASAASNEAEVASVSAAASQLDNKIAAWLADHMDGQYALSKYRTAGYLFVSMTPWQGSRTTDEGVNARDQLMSTLSARQANIQEMISSSQWDKP